MPRVRLLADYLAGAIQGFAAYPREAAHYWDNEKSLQICRVSVPADLVRAEFGRCSFRGGLP